MMPPLNYYRRWVEMQRDFYITPTSQGPSRVKNSVRLTASPSALPTEDAVSKT